MDGLPGCFDFQMAVRPISASTVIAATLRTGLLKAHKPTCQTRMANTLSLSIVPNHSIQKFSSPSAQARESYRTTVISETTIQPRSRVALSVGCALASKLASAGDGCRTRSSTKQPWHQIQISVSGGTSELHPSHNSSAGAARAFGCVRQD